MAGKAISIFLDFNFPVFLIKEIKMKYITTIIAVFVLSTVSVLQAQTVSHIKGSITDAEDGTLLTGASLVLFASDSQVVKGVISDEFGSFLFQTDRQGSFTIEISFIGYEKQIIPVELNGSEIDLGNIALQPSATELGDVIIRFSLEEKQRALNEQLNADNIKNVISSDLIGRFPDLNVAEALQRVPGVNIQRNKGEGSTVTIRGTPQHYTTIQINGEQIPSVQQDGSRNEALDLVPADLLSSMEITKSPTPDMDGDAIGGVVNLRTPVARSYDLGLRAEGALGYNDISGDINGIGKFRIDKRFLKTADSENGKLGVILGASLYQNNNSEDRVDATWSGLKVPIRQTGEESLVMNDFQYRNTKNVRTRTGFSATVDYKFNDRNDLVFKYMYAKREDEDLRNRLRFDLDRGSSIYHTLDSISDGRIRRDMNISDEAKENQSFHLEGNHSLNTWKIEWSGFYTFSERVLSVDRPDFATTDDIDIVVDRGDIFQDFPRFRHASGAQSMYDPFLYSDFRRYEENYETTDAHNIVGRIDITKSLDLFGEHPFYIKFGGKYRTQENSKFRDNQVFGFNDPNNILNTEEAFLRVLSGTEPDDFLYTDYRFGPLIGRDAFESYIDDNRRLLSTSDDAWDSRRISLNDTYVANEDVIAGYFMGRAQFNNLMVLAGLRYEKTQVNYKAYEVIRVGTDVQGTPISGGSDYSFLLPNLQLKYNLDDYTVLRFSSVFNYARPNFVDIVPFINYDEDATTLRLGNTELLPAKAFNLDLMFERYFSNVGVLAIGGFYKNIDNFQFTRIDPSLSQDFEGYPGTQGFRFQQEQNGENAVVAGVEVNFVRALDFLPWIFKNLSIDGNYTYTYSDAFTQDRTNISLPGQADHTFNMSLSGDYGDFSARVSGNYNGTFVSSLASQAQDDIYELNRLQIDANASYKIGKHIRIFTELTNITNEPGIRYQGERQRISKMAYFGWLARVGVSYRL